MIQKNKKQRRTFVPQPVSEALKKINRNFTAKFGKIEFIIQSKWSDIAGSYFAEYSEPKNITSVPEYENNIGEKIYKKYLNVSVSPAASLEFHHFKDKILEKINSYFGYKAIFDLRIQQNYIPNNKSSKKTMHNIELTDIENKKIVNEVTELDNSDLKESLIHLGKNIIKGNKDL